MKVLVADKLSKEGIKVFEDAGYEVDAKPGLSEDELIAIIPEYSGMVVRSATRATRAIIEAGKNLKIIGRAGVGLDNVDIEAATECGVLVCNAPLANVVSAAEQAFALMLAAARKTPQANESMHAGKWEKSLFTGTELYGKTLAIFGLGNIGSLIAKRALAFDMNVIGYDPYCPANRAAEIGVTKYDSVEEMLPLADFITVHLPKTPETIGMFSTEQFAAMKDGVIVVNDARGGIYDVDALAEALKSGKVAAAGIDVFDPEPCTESPLHDCPNCILTPHLGAATKEAQIRAATQIAEYVIAGMEGREVKTAVNRKALGL